MPVIIASKTEYTGTVSPPALNTETTVVEITAQSDTYIVEGYLDLSTLQSGDTLVVKEYISVDGQNYSTFLTVTYYGPVSDPIVRFHAKTLYKNMKYKVTITQTTQATTPSSTTTYPVADSLVIETQTTGTLRVFPYVFIVEVMGTA